MIKLVHKRALSLLLSMALVLTTMLPVTALAATQPRVTFLDSNNTETQAEAMVIDSGSTVLNSGWYVVDSGDVTIDQTVTVSGDVKLILADGANLTVNGTDGDNAGIEVTQGNSLSIYAQSIGSSMGRLAATGSGNGAGIGSEMFDSCGTISIYGGRITATGGNGDAGAAGIGNLEGCGASFGTIGIYGGMITATNGRFYNLPDIGGNANSGDRILIKGGTIVSNWSSHVVTLGVYCDFQGAIPKIIIDGGSIRIGTLVSDSSDPNPLKNSAGDPVPQSADALTVPGQANAAVASISVGGEPYGNSTYTDGSGNLYLHLPAYDSVIPVVITMDDGSKYWAAYQPSGDFPPQDITLANTEENPIFPGDAAFYSFSPEDITVCKWDPGHAFSGIRNGETSLIAGQDYTVDGDNITMKKEYLEKLPAGVTTLTFSGLGSGNATLPVTVYTIPEYVALGDSIATGYGLANYDPGAETPPAAAYASIVGNTLGLTTGSLACDGLDSSSLLSILSDPGYQAYLSKAKVLTLSIGSDDILQPFLEIVANQFDCMPGKIQAGLAALAQSDPAALAADLAALNSDDGSGLKNNQLLEEAASGFAGNFQSIISSLKAAAPNAKIYVTNVYNPYEGVNLSYGTGPLNLGDIADGYIRTLNSAFSTNSADYTLIDTYSAFSSSLKSGTSLVNTDPSVYNFDPHPNAAGHVEIANMILADYSGRPQIETSSLPVCYLGYDYDQTLKATGSAPVTWSIESGALPDGLTLNPNSGRISGTASLPGSFHFTVKATNAAGTATKALSIDIAALSGGVYWGNLIDQLSQDTPTTSVSSTAAGVLSLPPSDQSLLTSQQVTKLEELMKTALGATPPSIPAPVVTGFSGPNALPQSPPTVTGLILGTWGTSGTTTLTTTQEPPMPNITGAQLAFDLTLTAAGSSQPIHSGLSFPVTVTIQLPGNFTPRPGYRYSIVHTLGNGSSELLPVTIGGTAGNYTATFTTSSFSTFTLVGTYNGSSSGSHHSSGGSVSGPSVSGSTAAITFVSDTNADFSVNGAYQFRITSKNGTVPLLTVGTPGVFGTQLVRTSGNDYYFRLTAIGKPGDKAGIYVNGVKLLVATVGTAAAPVKSDTTASFKVAKGKIYTFKLTADSKPAFVTGNSSVFQVKFIKQSGRDYFYQVTAVGKVGQATGFYINAEKMPVTVATVA